MQLLIYYIAFVMIGDVLDYFIGTFVEDIWGSTAGLIVFLALYFLLLWVAWVIAVKVTKPKAAAIQNI